MIYHDIMIHNSVTQVDTRIVEKYNWSGTNSIMSVASVSKRKLFWPDCKPEGPLILAEFVCLCVSDRHFYPSTLTDFDETCSQGPYSDLVWPRP